MERLKFPRGPNLKDKKTHEFEKSVQRHEGENEPGTDNKVSGTSQVNDYLIHNILFNKEHVE